MKTKISFHKVLLSSIVIMNIFAEEENKIIIVESYRYYYRLKNDIIA
jgi:hypothetical protein